MSNLHTIRISRGRQLGFSLVELMIAMALSVVLMLGVVSIYTNSKQTYNVQEGVSRLQENARFAMGRLTREIAAAGYLGCLDASREVDDLPVIRNVLSADTGINNFQNPVVGVEGSGERGSDEITLTRANGGTAVPVIEPMDNSTDVITVDGNHREAAGISQFETVVIADCSQAVSFMVTNDPVSIDGEMVLEHEEGVPNTSGDQENESEDLEWVFGSAQNSQASLMRVSANRYTIRDSARGDCSDATPGFCALFENDQELVEGVQSMQILYGEDDSGDWDYQIDEYKPADEVGDWSRVVSVRVTLVINEVERIQGSNNGRTEANVAKEFTNTIRIRSRGT